MIAYPDAYLDYLIEFHATRDYFECHELLEAYWKSLPKDAAHRETWVALIQVAVAQYHARRGNVRGALKMFQQAASRIDDVGMAVLGLDAAALRQRIDERIAALGSPGAAGFIEFELPLRSPELLEACQARCSQHGLTWGKPSRIDDEQLIHRHTLRDRTDVIEARAAAATAKNKRQ